MEVATIHYCFSHGMVKPVEYLACPGKTLSARASALSDQYSLSALRRSLACHLVYIEDSDQAGLSIYPSRKFIMLRLTFSENHDFISYIIYQFYIIISSGLQCLENQKMRINSSNVTKHRNGVGKFYIFDDLLCCKYEIAIFKGTNGIGTVTFFFFFFFFLLLF